MDELTLPYRWEQSSPPRLPDLTYGAHTMLRREGPAHPVPSWARTCEVHGQSGCGISQTCQSGDLRSLVVLPSLPCAAAQTSTRPPGVGEILRASAARAAAVVSPAHGASFPYVDGAPSGCPPFRGVDRFKHLKYRALGGVCLPRHCRIRGQVIPLAPSTSAIMRSGLPWAREAPSLRTIAKTAGFGFVSVASRMTSATGPLSVTNPITPT